MIDIMDVNVKAAYQKAMISALNKTLAMLKTYVKRELSQTYNMRPSDVERYLKVVRASTTRQRGWIQAQHVRISLGKFKGTKQGQTGAEITIKQTKTLPGTFVAVMSSGHKGVYSRKDSKGNPLPYVVPRQGRYAGMTYKRMKGKVGQPLPRQKMRELPGPSMAQLFASTSMTKKMQEFCSRELPRIFVHEFNYYLTRR